MDNPAENIIRIECDPDSNRNLLQYSILRITMRVRRRNPQGCGPFRVVLRTNLNQAHRIRRQIIDLVEKGQSYSTDFYDIPTRYDPGRDEYGVQILLSEVGYFEFKVRVESVRRDQPWVRWADGPNIGISVRPLDYARDNSIYCAFIRQYVKNKNRPSLKDSEWEQTISQLEEKGAYVIGPSGNFENFIEVLPFIVKELGMKIIHLLPINPVPVTYGRMGMYGSPYATTDYFGIDQTYATFSRYKTIEEQFIDLTSTIHALGAKVILDMVINHTGWAGNIHLTHRQWRKVEKDGEIVSPGVWGVTWGDLVELDYSHPDLWRYMADVFLAWCRRGIDGFRLDAGYKVPGGVWKYIISKVREEFPNTLFLLEGLGGPWETTEKLLTEGQINWAYSELFQNYTRPNIVRYLEYAQRVSAGKGVLVHYAETHDNERLANKGRNYARMRLYLSALTSFSGAWGITNGLEWLATERIDVHRNSGLNWGHPDNLVGDIARLNKILAENPAFWSCDHLEICALGDDDLLAFIRRDEEGGNVIACVINLNVDKARSFKWDWTGGTLASRIKPEARLQDLWTEQYIDIPSDMILRGNLSAGGCLIYRLNPSAQIYKPSVPAIFEVERDRVALIYHILLSRFKTHEVSRIDQEKLLRQVEDFRRFIVLVNTTSLERLHRADIAALLREVKEDMLDRYCALWTFSERNKEFIISGDKWLIVQTFLPCSAYLETPAGTVSMDSMADAEGVYHLAYFPPQPENQGATLTFNWKIKGSGKMERQWHPQRYPILSVPSGQRAPRPRKIYPICLAKSQLMCGFDTVVLTNAKGALAQLPARCGSVISKYDCLLSIAAEPSRPAVRLTLAKMIKETIRVGDKVFDLDESFLDSFTRFPQPHWEFVYDDGEYFLRLERTLAMPAAENSLYIRYRLLEANTQVVLTCLCYVECRSPHDQLKATEQLRRHYAHSCRTLTNPSGVEFTPHPDIKLRIVSKQGEFISQPHWIYDLSFPQDAERGLDDKGDAFCPGLFNFELSKSESRLLLISTEPPTADKNSFRQVFCRENKRLKDMLARVPVKTARSDPLVKMLVEALDQFLVHSGSDWQVLAGLPWLGVRVREALGCVGGLLVAGRDDVACDVVLRSAQSERDGMLLEWLSGGPEIRHSMDTALQLFLAAKNYVTHTGNMAFWDSLIGDQRTVREVLIDIYESLRDRIGGGPRLDNTSGLLYCPAGFTWMNTDNPRATPRAGYPVEIQAWWYQALEILAEIFPPYAQQASQLRRLIEQNFMSCFWDETRGHLSDVLLAGEDIPAAQAIPDRTLRFNQLGAILAHLVPADQARQIIDVLSRRLLIPAGLRSLTEIPLPVALNISDRQGKLLVDPHHPYRGRCMGDETQRRLAYHNGTAWPWAYPGFIEARALVFDFSELAVQQALAFFEPLWTELAQGGIGSISEMKDGDFPHRPRGCYAYSLSVAEALRVYMLLKYRLYQRCRESQGLDLVCDRQENSSIV